MGRKRFLLAQFDKNDFFFILKGSKIHEPLEIQILQHVNQFVTLDRFDKLTVKCEFIERYRISTRNQCFNLQTFSLLLCQFATVRPVN